MLHAHPARQCEILLSAPSCLARQPPRREDAKVLVDRNMMPRAAGVDAKRPAARGGGHGGVCPSGAFKHPGDRLACFRSPRGSSAGRDPAEAEELC